MIVLNLYFFVFKNVDFSLPGSDAPSTELLANASQVMTSRVVTVTPNGLLKSYGTLGHAMLIVVATDEYGLKQLISVIVEVCFRIN